MIRREVGKCGFLGPCDTEESEATFGFMMWVSTMNLKMSEIAKSSSKEKKTQIIV